MIVFVHFNYRVYMYVNIDISNCIMYFFQDRIVDRLPFYRPRLLFLTEEVQDFQTDV